MKQADHIRAHYSRIWSDPIESIRWDRGPIGDLPDDFSVLVIERSPEMLAYATCCMSQPEDDERLELHMLSRSESGVQKELVELLTVVAHYHRTGRSLGLGHTVNFGRPWLPGSRCEYGLISLPYLDGPDLEWMDRPRTCFLWLIPITARELAFKKSNGLEALEQRFDESQFDYLDPKRASVA